MIPNPGRAACTSPRCGTAVRWWLTTRGKPIPTDYTPDPAGRLLVVEHAGEQRLRIVPAGQSLPSGVTLYTPHWSTCVDPAIWHDIRRTADPGGELPLRTPGRARADASLGPCVRCGGMHPRYGPGGKPVCDACLQADTGRSA